MDPKTILLGACLLSTFKLTIRIGLYGQMYDFFTDTYMLICYQYICNNVCIIMKVTSTSSYYYKMGQADSWNLIVYIKFQFHSVKNSTNNLYRA